MASVSIQYPNDTFYKSLHTINTLTSHVQQLKCQIPPASEPITVLAKTITGLILTVSINPKDTVLKLKQQIFIKEGVFLDQQRIIFNGKQLDENKTIESYNIGDKDIVHLILRLRGGMFHETSSRKDFVSITFTQLFDASITMIYQLRKSVEHPEIKLIIEELYIKLKNSTTEGEMTKIHELIQNIYIS
jgi:hypothetical protein